MEDVAGEGARMPKPGSEDEWKSPFSACSNMCWGAILEGWLKLGVPVREMGDCDRSDKPEEILPDARRCSWPSASGWAAGRPPVSLFYNLVSGPQDGRRDPGIPSYERLDRRS